MKLSIAVFCLLLFTWLNADDHEIKNIFSKAELEGSLLISNLKGDQLYVYNEKKLNERFSPASTFKIPHTLIALEEGVIKSQNDTIKWDGKKREYELWNKDQTLKSAMAVSCVWCYKKFTQEIAKEKYIKYLQEFDYGNKTVGKDKASFWLNGALQISAYEQIEFLKKLYTGQLPISKQNIAIVKEILSVEKNKEYEIKAKTGWSGEIGWYVGYVKTQKEVYFFALNATVTKEQLDLRKELVYKALKAKNII